MSPAAEERPGAALARFAARRGYPVLDALGAYWWRQHRFIYESLPQQRALALEPAEVGALLRRRHLAGLRYPTQGAAGEPNALFVCRTAGFELARICGERRRQLRRAQEVATFREVDPDELLAQGLALNLETMQRQRRFTPELGEPARWAHFVRAVRDTPEVQAVGAFVDGRLGAYEVVCRDGRWLHSLVKMTRTQDLKLHAGVALDLWLLQRAAQDPGLDAFASGLANHVRHLVDYKTSIGLELEPLRTATQLHPALRRVIGSRLTARATAGLAHTFPRVKRLGVLAGASQTARSAAAGEAAHHG